MQYPRGWALRSGAVPLQVNMSRFVIPTLLLGVYVLWMYDRSHREVRHLSALLSLAVAHRSGKGSWQ
jgi:hypothetical protein